MSFASSVCLLRSCYSASEVHTAYRLELMLARADEGRHDICVGKRRRPDGRGATPAAQVEPRHAWLAQPIVIAIGLVAINLFIYSTVRHFQLVNWDDSTYVTENPTVLGGLSWSSAWWALTTGHSPYWHPMTWLSHLLDVTLFGADAGMYHVTNLVIHMRTRCWCSSSFAA